MSKMNHSQKTQRYLYQLLKDTNLMDHRHELVLSFTNDRTTKSSLMYPSEIYQLLEYLKDVARKKGVTNEDFKMGEQMRKKIFSLCYTMGWTKFSRKKGRMVVDQKALDEWMQKYSYLHKPLNRYKYKELPELVTQFERMAKTYLE